MARQIFSDAIEALGLSDVERQELAIELRDTRDRLGMDEAEWSAYASAFVECYRRRDTDNRFVTLEQARRIHPDAPPRQLSRLALVRVGDLERLVDETDGGPFVTDMSAWSEALGWLESVYPRPVPEDFLKRPRR